MNGNTTMIDVVWDMETNDPDDFLTLCLLAGHPQVNLKAVTVLPGSPQQIGLVRWALRQFELNIPVGAHNLKTTKPSVSQWHYDAYENISPSEDAQPAAEILLQYCDSQTTLLTGAALTNVRNAINNEQQKRFTVGRLMAQGGFAGEGVVPSALQLDKFRGLITSPTHNLIGDNKAANAVLAHDGIGRRYFVAKNVCHRVYYDQKLHEHIDHIKDKSLALSLIWQGMDVYLKQDPVGKLLHDPLAACCAIDETVGT
jgi:inosine-uridine nucleoside N-ribohydrolase